MCIRDSTWPLVLMAFNGQLPENEEAFRILLDSLRHQGHIAESPQAGSNSWTGRGTGQHLEACLYGMDLSPSRGGDVSHTDGDWSFWGGPGGQACHAEPQTFLDEDGWTACRDCESYLDDPATSTDAGRDWEDAADTPELQAYLGSFEGCTAHSLREDYFLARARFRHFTGRS